MKLRDLTGQKFGRLTVVERCLDTDRHTKWTCRCECGNYTNVTSDALTRGKTKSCGCYMREKAKSDGYVHGKSHTRLHNIWVGMRNRCNDPNSRIYKYYGGRGIKVCDEWDSYVAFENWALQNGYEKTLTIDRIENEMGYSPNNCRWVTQTEQSKNRRPYSRSRRSGDGV